MHQISSSQKEALLKTLKARFDKNTIRHPGLDWAKVTARLENNPEKLWSLNEMEITGGEPDVVGDFIFFDCVKESPRGRRSLCYDQAALDSRKTFKPKDSAVNMAKSMGIDILTEQQYHELQQLGIFDIKTSSWLKTPPEIRSLGGAIFADRRYNHVFIYHNGADSYYAVRGFRGCLQI